MASVVLQELTKYFTQPNGAIVCAVQNVTLTIEDKQFFVIVGPSGCGKTTTLRLIAGLEKPAHGTIALDELLITNLPPKDRDMAMVFQTPALYPHMSVYDNMAFGLKLRSHPATEIRRRVEEAAELLELSPWLACMPQTLSGGQRQRVALGRAMVRQPQVFLLDEPLCNLDPVLRSQMRGVIANLHQRGQRTTLYVTHDQVEALALGHRIAVMRDGTVQQVADPFELYNHPANLFVAGFLGSPPMNFFRGTFLKSNGKWIFQEEGTDLRDRQALSFQIPDHQKIDLEKCAGRPLIFGLRPEQIVPPTASAPNSMVSLPETEITAIQRLGAQTTIQLGNGAGGFAASLPGSALVHAKEKIPLCFNAREARFFDATTEKAVN